MESRIFTAHICLIDSTLTQVRGGGGGGGGEEGVLTKVLCVAFHIPSVDHCDPFNCCNTLFLKYTQITKLEGFLDFLRQKRHLLALLGLFTDWNDRFSYPFI